MQFTKKTIKTATVFVILFSGIRLSATNAFLGPISLPEGFLLAGIHGEYGSTVNSDSVSVKRPAAAGASFQAVFRLPDTMGFSLLGDISNEIIRNNLRGRYGLEIYLENNLFVSRPHTKFSIELRGGGISRFSDDSGSGFFYGIGILYPTPEYDRDSSDIICSLGIEGNRYIRDGHTDYIDVVFNIRVLYKFRL